jgi:hypothetical protein
MFLRAQPAVCDSNGVGFKHLISSKRFSWTVIEVVRRIIMLALVFVGGLTLGFAVAWLISLLHEYWSMLEDMDQD